MARRLSITAIAFVSLLFSNVGAPAQSPGESQLTFAPPPFDSEEQTPVLVQPIASLRPAPLSDGNVQLNYELELRVSWRTPVVIEGLEVVDPMHGDAVVASWTAEELLPLLKMPGRAAPTASWSPGESGFLRVNLVFDGTRAVPPYLDHRLTVAALFPPATEVARKAQRLARCAVYQRRPPVISPPVAGDRWVAVVVGGDLPHRKMVAPLNGRWVAPERWAVDWIQLDPGFHLATGDPELNESYPQYLQPLLAVADGRVVKTRDGMPDIPAGKAPSGITMQDATGNYVVLDIGQGYSALYAHISPGTLRVSEGQWVRRGQILGLLGNSGNTTGPHLHFHVNDGILPLASDGVPYVIDRFHVQGIAVSEDDLETEMKHPEVPVVLVPGPRPGMRAREMPADLSVVSFPEHGGR